MMKYFKDENGKLYIEEDGNYIYIYGLYGNRICREMYGLITTMPVADKSLEWFREQGYTPAPVRWGEFDNIG